MEHPDPRPVEIPAGLERPLSIQEEIQRFLGMELMRRDMERGDTVEESFEEFDDLDEDEPDPEIMTPYVVMEDDVGENDVYHVKEDEEGPAPESENEEGPSEATHGAPAVESPPTPPGE